MKQIETTLVLQRSELLEVTLRANYYRGYPATCEEPEEPAEVCDIVATDKHDNEITLTNKEYLYAEIALHEKAESLQCQL